MKETDTTLILNNPELIGPHLFNAGIKSVKVFPQREMDNSSGQVFILVSFEKYVNLLESLKKDGFNCDIR